MTVPSNPKIYHIVHVDRLPFIIAAGGLLSDAQMGMRTNTGTTIGMSSIKNRRLTELRLSSYPDLFVGQCVPFYFCPRSIMLYILHRNNHDDVTYRGGQTPIVHLEVDLHKAVEWAEQSKLRWAFTTSNAGSYYFEDFSDLDQLDKIDWVSVQSQSWQNCKEAKQAEFLVERMFPWGLVERIGVYSHVIQAQVNTTIPRTNRQPSVEIKQNWYY